LQQPQPDDYVIATGEAHTVREFTELAFALAGLDWRRYIVSDPDLYRPSEVNTLLGDAGKARRVLGWTSHITFPELVREMVLCDCRARGVDAAGLLEPTPTHERSF
jgi:GDPmannose 4,6-dehydratase